MAKSAYSRHNKTPYKYPARERTICTCGAILFKGLNDGSPGAVVDHQCPTKRKRRRKRNG